MKFYYKVVQKHEPVGKIIDTNDCVNEYRVKRNNELKNYFNRVYNFSKDFETPILLVLNDVLLNFNQLPDSFIKRINYNLKLKFLAKERKKCFFINEEAIYFIDYILEKTRINLQTKEKVILPNRFKSSFFFESETDSKAYLNSFQNPLLRIIKVEFIEETLLKKFDNNLVSEFFPYYTARDYDSQCKLYLSGIFFDKALVEVVFQGKYQIKSTISL
jgi:hypothetical protein